MFGVAATGGRIERRAVRRLSSWTRDYLRAVALADLGCAELGRTGLTEESITEISESVLGRAYRSRSEA